MAFDGIITKSVVYELNKTLIGGKINKIYEPNKNEIILDIYNKCRYQLDICIEASNYRINITNHNKVNPKIAPNFCMVLRKYLTSSKIISISSYELDRIVILELENYNELNDKVNYKLIIELMGKHSNVILLNNKNIIIDSIRHISSENALRTILPANPYIFTISDKINLLDIKCNEFIENINSLQNNDLLEILPNTFNGISKSFSFLALKHLNIISHDYTNENLINLFEYIKNILHFKNINFEEFIFNNKKDFSIVIDNSNIISNDLYLNKLIDDFYYNKENNEIFINYRNTILRLILSHLNKYNKKLVNIQNKLDECNDIEKYRLYGELITANLYRISNNINISYIELENYYDNNNLIKINLDSKYSPSINAKNFFKKYNKLKSTLKYVSVQKANILNEISYLDSIVFALENACTSIEIAEIYQEISENILKEKINKNADKEKRSYSNIEETNIDGYKIYVGKNNKQNDYITFKLSDKNDIWFHVQDSHGSHVLLKTNNTDIPNNSNIILKCAKLAVLHSKANNEKKVLVNYTLVKNIKKPKNSKPGFVIFNNYNTIIVEN